MKFYLNHKDLPNPLEIQKPFRLHDLAEIESGELRCIFWNEARELITSLYKKYGIDMRILLIIENNGFKSEYQLLIYTMTITENTAEVTIEK